MIDPRVQSLSRVVCEYSLELKPGQVMLIEGPALAEPLMLELVKTALEMGAIPRVRPVTAGAQVAFLENASDEQLAYLAPNALPELAAIDVRVAIHAAWNTRELSGIDPRRMAAAQSARKPLMDLNMRRSADGLLTWCVTAFPCEAFAQDAGMALADYEDFVYRAGWLHLADPVAAWRDFAAKLKLIVDRLTGVRTMRVVGEDTDITAGRRRRR